jgi:hypothetical protein
MYSTRATLTSVGCLRERVEGLQLPLARTVRNGGVIVWNTRTCNRQTECDFKGSDTLFIESDEEWPSISD